MKVAALDFGTNTFLCLILQRDSDGRLQVLEDATETVRLGQGVDKTGRFHPEALDRARECLARFRTLIDRRGVSRVEAVATSAARDVENGDELFKITEHFKIPLRVIDGAEEARLSYRGAVMDKTDQETRLVIDVGGGSTELIVGRGSEILFRQSLDVGAVRLTERCVTEQPVKIQESVKVEETVDAEIATVLSRITAESPTQILAVAGTPTALAAIELGGYDRDKIDGFFLSIERLREWNQEFRSTTVEHKRTRYNLGGRADIVYAGTTILLRLLEKMSAPGFHVSVKGLRYGLALELLHRS